MQSPPAPLPRATPEAQGIPSETVLKFLEAAKREFDSLHSLILLRRGQVVAEGWWAPYSPDRRHLLFSLSKSFTATAAGLAAAEGLMRLDDFVTGFFPDELPPEISGNLAAMRIRDLLTMTTGHREDSLWKLFSQQGGTWARAFLSQPVDFKPGSHFLYNSGATYMVSAIVQKVTGQTLLQYLQPRLFEPLGIENPAWESSPEGINAGGWGMSVRTEDIARFGQLYLQNGVWNGRRLLPEGWVAEATAKQVPNGSNPDSDWNQGYGYQFWRCRHDAYRGDGAFGQYCVVMPKQNAVLAMTSGLSDLQGVLNLVWKYLLPSLGAEKPLPGNTVSQEKLRTALDHLTIAAPEGKAESPMAEAVSGRAYTLESDIWFDKVTFHFAGATCILMLHGTDGEDRRIVCGEEWVEGTTDAFSPLDARTNKSGLTTVAARGAWPDPNTYIAQLCWVETPFIGTLICRFTEDGAAVTLDYTQNVNFGPAQPIHLSGTL